MEKRSQYVSAYQQYYRLVAMRAYAVTGNAPVSHEIAQEAFMRLTLYIDDLTNMEHVKRWLQRVAINLALDYMREQKHCRESSLEDALVLDTLVDEMDMTENFCMRVLLKDVMHYVNSWDELSAYIFKSKLSGFRNREIAEHVGLRPEAVEDRYLKLRRRVCKKFYTRWMELEMPSEKPKKRKNNKTERKQRNNENQTNLE